VNTMKKKIAVVLLSGGLDSTTVATLVKKQYSFETHALTIHYGQKLSKEVKHAAKIAEKLGLPHKIILFPDFRGTAFFSALTNYERIEIPKERSFDEIQHGIPATYVPFRNTLFLTVAAAFLESITLQKLEKEKINPKNVDARVFIGANAVDYSGYPDCRPEYFKKINDLLPVASKIGVEYGIKIRIEAPLLHLTKKEIVELGTKIKAPYEWSWSCYEGGEIPCGKCDSCLLRAKGFEEAGISDPLIQRLKKEGKM